MVLSKTWTVRTTVDSKSQQMSLQNKTSTSFRRPSLLAKIQEGFTRIISNILTKAFLNLYSLTMLNQQKYHFFSLKMDQDGSAMSFAGFSGLVETFLCFSSIRHQGFHLLEDSIHWKKNMLNISQIITLSCLNPVISDVYWCMLILFIDIYVQITITYSHPETKTLSGNIYFGSCSPPKCNHGSKLDPPNATPLWWQRWA